MSFSYYTSSVIPRANDISIFIFIRRRKWRREGRCTDALATPPPEHAAHTHPYSNTFKPHIWKQVDKQANKRRRSTIAQRNNISLFADNSSPMPTGRGSRRPTMVCLFEELYFLRGGEGGKQKLFLLWKKIKNWKVLVKLYIFFVIEKDLRLLLVKVTKNSGG
jgi:hypothetical protein